MNLLCRLKKYGVVDDADIESEALRNRQSAEEIAKSGAAGKGINGPTWEIGM
jgi:hypothetical protein